MAAPAQPLDIVNLAILRLFARPITSLNDVNSPVARAASLVYDQERRSLLRQVSWNFAKLRGIVTLTADLPIVSMNGTETLYSYQMPNDLIRLLSVGWDERSRYEQTLFDVKGRKVLLNPFQAGLGLVPTALPPATLDVLYISDAVLITEWDPLFIDTLVYKLAVSLCFPVTGNTSMIETLAALYEESLKLAEGVNFQEVPMLWTQPDPILSARASIGSDFGDQVWGG